ncbi:MAG TPA: hypothetical protein V6C95_01145 [Coleofasciculaceae cyanobacterium]
MQKAFSGEYIIQDDARQHVFWMGRFLDPELFPKDIIADYFQSVAPPGYTALYHFMATLGIEPVVLSKLLPLILGLITTAYCFGLCLQLFPIPLSGFIAAQLLNQNLWMQDGFTSGTPKAFLYPLFLAFLYYLLKRSQIPCTIVIALLGLFYPSLVFICAGVLILQLWHIEQGKLYLTKNRKDYIRCATGLGVILLVLLFYALSSSEFGPVITAAEAKTLPEFSAKGRSSFFNDDTWRFWFNASRSGIRFTSALMPPLVYAGLLLPILLRFSLSFPLAKKINSNIIVLPQLILASFTVYFAAHALIFKLHLPSRYTQHTLRMVMVLAASIALTMMLDAMFCWAGSRQIKPKNFVSSLQVSRLGALASSIVLVTTLILYPASLKSFPWTGYIIGQEPKLYEFFQKQPKDSLIASLSEEVNNLPTFSQRSILVGSEYAIPYHVGYYHPFRQRILELIQAQYSPNLGDAQNLIQKYGIDFWMFDRTAFTPDYIDNNSWLEQFEPAADALTKLHQGSILALSKVSQSCTVFETDNLVVLQADCIVKTHNVQ